MTREQCAGLKPGDKVYVTKGCPDGNPRRTKIRRVMLGGIGVYVESENGGCACVEEKDVHIAASDAVARFEQLRAAAIARVEKQIRTLPDRLNKLRHRQPVIEGKE